MRKRKRRSSYAGIAAASCATPNSASNSRRSTMSTSGIVIVCPLVFASRAFVGPRDPDADALLAPLAAHVESVERADQPFLQSRHIAAHVRRAVLEVQHQIDHALAGAVIGELSAAPGLENGKARLNEVARLRAGACGVEGRMLEQPDKLARLAFRDRGSACLHHGECVVIGYEPFAYAPFGRRKPLPGEAKFKLVADVNHLLTIPW
jgi:hypothetical protein